MDSTTKLLIDHAKKEGDNKLKVEGDVNEKYTLFRNITKMI
jgi:hypothetical protein